MTKEPEAVVFIDTETTGFTEDGASGELIHFAAVKLNNSKFSRFFLPSGPISDSAAKIHGLTMEKLKEEGARPFSRDDAEEILEFTGTGPLVVMHNKDFDLKVLLKAFKAV